MNDLVDEPAAIDSAEHMEVADALVLTEQCLVDSTGSIMSLVTRPFELRYGSEQCEKPNLSFSRGGGRQGLRNMPTVI